MTRQMFNPVGETAPAAPVERKVFNPADDHAREKAIILRKEELKTAPLGPLKTWSFSALSTFEQCPYRSYLTRVEGAKEPSGTAADRGTKLHGYIEDYIQGKEPELHNEIKHFVPLIDDLRAKHEEGTVEVEGNWAFDRNWNQTDWSSPDTWGRVKLDAIEFEGETSAVIIDWKSGKKFGNEVKHATQLVVYAIATFERFPDLEYLTGMMAYIDKNEELKGSYTRELAMQLKPKIEQRALAMTTAIEFPPKPSQQNCRWCHLKKPLEGEEEARCKWGVV
jgi:CRISPR/Cas system-associated exonuclease Cas4 (RecB family)